MFNKLFQNEEILQEFVDDDKLFNNISRGAGTHMWSLCVALHAFLPRRGNGDRLRVGLYRHMYELNCVLFCFFAEVLMI